MVSLNLLGLSSVFVVAVIWIGFFSALGTCVARVLFRRTYNRCPFWDRMWLGLFSMLLWLMILQIFYPVNMWSLIPMLIWIGISFFRKTLRIQDVIPKKWALFHGLSLLFLVASIWFTRHHYTNADTGLYHLATIQWFSEYPIIRGVGNLNTQYAYNQSGFLWGSLFRLMPLRLTERPFINPLLWWVAMLPSLRSTIQVLLSKRQPTRLRTFHMVLFPMWCALPYMIPIHNPSPDFHTGILSLRLLELCVLGLLSDQRKIPVFVLTICTVAVAVVIKLTIGMMAVGTAVCTGVGFLIYLKRTSAPLKAWGPPVGIAVTSGLLLIGVWFYRGYLIAGIPGYPILTSSPLPHATWEIPEATVIPKARLAMNRSSGDRKLRKNIGLHHMGHFSTHRQNYLTLLDLDDPNASWSQFHRWFPAWWDFAISRWYFRIPFQFLLFILGCVVLCIRSLSKGRGLLALVGIPLTHLGLCFLSFPLLRYMGITVWLICIPLVSGVLFSLKSPSGFRPAGVGVLGCWAGVLLLLIQTSRPYHQPTLSLDWWDRAPQPDLPAYTSDGGVTWRVNEEERMVYDAIFPSGLYLNPDIRYLDPEKGLRGGLYVETN